MYDYSYVLTLLQVIRESAGHPHFSRVHQAAYAELKSIQDNPFSAPKAERQEELFDE